MAPNAEWLTGAEDVRLLLQWVRANIEPYGGNPNNIVLMGNHVSHVLSIGSADTTVTNTIMRFYHSVIDAR